MRQICNAWISARRCLGVGLALAIVAAFVWWFWPRERMVDGQVIDTNGPVANAHVRSQGAAQLVRTDATGHFRLESADTSKPVTAAKTGHIIASASAARGMRLHLDLAPTTDHVGYEWIDPTPDPAHPRQCGNCHGGIQRDWLSSAHARSATNPRFLDMIAPKDGRAAWNLRTEHPEGIHVCARCHVPTMTPPDFDFDPHGATGVAAKGVHCDLCHKIADVPIDKLGTRFGIDGLDLRRPADERQLFFGPLDDAVRPGETFVYAPVYKESRYCASCHEGVVFGVHVYGTFSEWQKSKSAREGRSCQSCHMASEGTLTNIAPGKGGVERDPRTLSGHKTPGATPEMLKRCLTLTAQAKRLGRDWHVIAEVATHDVGHRVPTGFIDRHLVLVLEATDANGVRVAALEGSLLPTAAGVGFAGQAGKLYAKMQVDAKGNGPMPFWVPSEKGIDSRLFPDDADRVSFLWPPTARQVRVRLLHRRLWPHVTKAADNEILVHEQTIVLE